MALITKIQQHSGAAVTVIVIAIILFIVGGDLMSTNSILRGGATGTEIGTIDGKDVTATQYQNELAQLEYEYEIANGKAAGEQERQGFREQAWNQLVNIFAFEPDFEKIGLKVTDAELTDMVQGENIHPGLKQAFTDPATGQVNRDKIVQYLKDIDKYKSQNQEAAKQYAIWLNFERKLPQDRKRTKFEALLTKSVYVTSAEAEREYTNQTAKASAKYFFVPYYNLPDSTFKPTDDQLNKYLVEHKDKYRVQDGRTLDYVQFMISPDRQDSIDFQNEVASLKGEFAAADNDTAYAKSKSDNPQVNQSLAVNELPALLQGVNLTKDSIYGPFTQGDEVKIYKVSNIDYAGDKSAKASHILIKWNNESDSSKANAKARATKILNQIKGGASFEDMARQYGTDGTASQGGDLGWFKSGAMVKPFEDAVFNASSTGLLPTLTETQFGYHLIKVTEKATNLKYQVVQISRKLEASSRTRQAIEQKANEFLTGVSDAKSFEEKAKAANLTKLVASNILKNAMYINDISEGREVVRWAYLEAKVGEPAKVPFALKDRFVIPVVTRITTEGNVNLDDVRDQVVAEVRKQLKFEQMLSKVQGAKSLEEMKNKYGAGAVVNTATDINMAGGSMPDIGYDPVALGKLFGMKKGQTSAPFMGESGIVAFTCENTTPAPKIADYNTYKTNIQSRRSGPVSYYLLEAMKDLKKIKDERIQIQ